MPENMQPDPEFEKLVKKAKNFVDIEVIMRELDRRIDIKVRQGQTDLARSIIDKIPDLKPDVGQLAMEIAKLIDVAEVDQVVAKVLERIPSSDAAEFVKMRDELSKQLMETIRRIGENMAADIPRVVDEKLMAEKSAMVAVVEEKMQQHHDSMLQEISTSRGGSEAESNGEQQRPARRGGLGGLFGDIPWDKLLDFMKESKTESDPLAGISKILELREKLAVLDPQGPDINSIFTTGRSGFLEGLKVGARMKGASGETVKKSSSPPGGRSTSQPKSSGLHPAVERL